MNDIIPVTRSKHSARRYYDRISAVYDWLTASEKNLIRKGVDILSPSPGETILEIGSGTGSGLKFMSDQLSGEGHLIGLDLSHKMILTSQEKLRHISKVCSLIQGDGSHLPLYQNILDAVFCSFTLELFSKKEISAVLKEIHGVLKPGGRLAVLSLSDQPKTLAERLYTVGHRLFPKMLDCRPIPLLDLLVESGYRILYQEKSLNWGLPIQIVLCESMN